MTDVVTRFKAGTPGGPPLPPDDREWRPGSSLGSRRSKRLGAARAKDRATIPDRPAVRWEVLAQAGDRCQAHGMHASSCPGQLRGRRWEAHHPFEISDGGDENGIQLALWPDCHARIHSNPGDAIRLGHLASWKTMGDDGRWHAIDQVASACRWLDVPPPPGTVPA